MAETSLGSSSVLKTVLRSAAAGFVFGEAALFAVGPSLTEDGALQTAASSAAARTGSTGVAVVMACLAFTSVLVSLGNGFLFAALVMSLWTKAGVRVPWLTEVTTGVFVVVGAASTGVLTGLLPTWIYLAAQITLVLYVYSQSNINDMTTALLIIFTTLYITVACGRLGAIWGFLSIGLTIIVLCVLRMTLSSSQRPKSKTGCKLLERILFYSVFVGTLGFFVGLGAGETGEGSKTEVVLMLQSVLWVAFLSAGLLGAGLGTVGVVGLGPEVAGSLTLGASIALPVALRAILLWSSSLGVRSCTGGTLGATAAAGVSLGAASVAAEHMFGSRKSTFAVLGSVAVGVFVAVKAAPLKPTLLTMPELVTVVLVAVGAFVLGAPNSPFNTQVNLRQGLLTGTELIKGIGMETVTAAAAPIGAGALGAAALGTAALGRLGTAGVLVAILLALGGALSGWIGKPPTTDQRRD
ncbi:unnamed protein product [Ophioblennius macclurei]